VQARGEPRTASAEPAGVRNRGAIAAERGEAARGPERPRGMRWRARRASAAAAGAMGSTVVTIAGLVMGLAIVIALLIALAIVLVDVNANSANTIVTGIHEGANFFAGSFTGLIEYSGHPKRAISVDWGIAAVVYLLVGALIAALIARAGRVGLRRREALSAG
jgi:hypothetical protein